MKRFNRSPEQSSAVTERSPEGVTVTPKTVTGAGGFDGRIQRVALSVSDRGPAAVSHSRRNDASYKYEQYQMAFYGCAAQIEHCIVRQFPSAIKIDARTSAPQLS
jgi:hypothetical protein